MRPHRPDKTRFSPKRRNQWRGWVTHVRIDRNPGIRGTRSASTRRAKETALLNTLRWYDNNNSSKGLVVV